MATTATFFPFPAQATPQPDPRFEAGLTCGALVTAGTDASPVALDYTGFKRWNGSTAETVDLSNYVPRLLVVSNTGSATVNLYPDGLTNAAGGYLPIPAGASVQVVTRRVPAFSLKFGSTAGGEVVSVIAIMDGSVVTA